MIPNLDTKSTVSYFYHHYIPLEDGIANDVLEEEVKDKWMNPLSIWIKTNVIWPLSSGDLENGWKVDASESLHCQGCIDVGPM